MPRGSGKFGAAHHHRRGIRRIRAMAMALEKIYGSTNLDIGRRYKITPERVRTTLDWAEHEGILADLESQLKLLQEQVAREIAPKVIKVYNKALDAALESGDVTAARDILKGFWNAKILAAPKGGDDGIDYEAYFIRRRAANQLDQADRESLGPTDSVPRLAEGHPAIDAEILEPARKQPVVATQEPPAGPAPSGADIQQD